MQDTGPFGAPSSLEELKLLAVMIAQQMMSKNLTLDPNPCRRGRDDWDGWLSSDHEFRYGVLHAWVGSSRELAEAVAATLLVLALRPLLIILPPEGLEASRRLVDDVAWRVAWEEASQVALRNGFQLRNDPSTRDELRNLAQRADLRLVAACRDSLVPGHLRHDQSVERRRCPVCRRTSLLRRLLASGSVVSLCQHCDRPAQWVTPTSWGLA